MSELSAELLSAVERYYELTLQHWENSCALLMYSPRAAREILFRRVLRRRVKYGGRKGRRAARRLRVLLGRVLRRP